MVIMFKLKLCTCRKKGGATVLLKNVLNEAVKIINFTKA